METLKRFLFKHFTIMTFLWMSAILVFTYFSMEDVKRIYIEDYKTITSLTGKNIHYILDLYYSRPVVEFNLQNVKFRFDNVQAVYLLYRGETFVFPESDQYFGYFNKCKNVKKETLFQLDDYFLVCYPLYEELATELIVERQKEGVFAILFKKDYMFKLIKNWIIKDIALLSLVILLSIFSFMWVINRILKNLDYLAESIKTAEEILSTEEIESRKRQKLRKLYGKFQFEEFKRTHYLIERMVNRIVKLTQELKKQAIIDSLTGLYNRNYLENFTEGIVSLAQRQESPFSVAIIDIDDFKLVNDTYGHKKGDEVLKTLGKLIKENIRKSDIPIRYGGEEILILFPNTEKKKASYVLDRIRKKFSKIDFGIGKSLTFSGGIASYPEDIKEPLSLESLIEIADRRLYKAKQSGKNRIVVRE